MGNRSTEGRIQTFGFGFRGLLSARRTTRQCRLRGSAGEKGPETSSPEALADEVDVKTARLITVLVQLEGRFRALGADRWADWVGESRAHISAGDGWGLKHFIGAFGGMGSITDTAIGAEGEALLSEAYDLANWLGQQLEREDLAFPFA